MWSYPNLKGKICVVTGSSRGAGKGIASSLGKCGATVYVTGRSSRALSNATEGLSGTIEDTADLVTSNGGIGIPVLCNHTVSVDVQKLFDRVKADHGHLDLLVNAAWGGYESYTDSNFDAPFWEQPDEVRWHAMYEAGVHATLLSSCKGALLMMPQKRGIIINLTSADKNNKYMGNLYYDVAKGAINRMAFGLAEELRPHNVCAVALAPGWMRTERVMKVLEEQNTKEELEKILVKTETVEYVGRAVASLLADEKVIEKSGKLLTAGDLAQEYNFTDVDGKQPPPFSF